jgi:hypothetical protein
MKNASAASMVSAAVCRRFPEWWSLVVCLGSVESCDVTSRFVAEGVVVRVAAVATSRC